MWVGGTVAVPISRPVYMDLHAAFRQVKGHQRAEVTSQESWPLPCDPHRYSWDHFLWHTCNVKCVICVLTETTCPLCTYSVCMHSSYVPLYGLEAPLWGKCPYVSDSSSYFTEVTAWVWLARLLTWWLLDAESRRHMWGPAGALTAWEMVPRCTRYQNLTT